MTEIYSQSRVFSPFSGGYGGKKLISLPPGIAKLIRDAQGYNPDARTITMIDKEISWTDNLFQMKRNDFINQQIIDGEYIDVINILEEDNSKADQAELVGTYISNGSLDLAEAKLSEYAPENEQEEQWVELSGGILEKAKDSLLAIEVDSVEEAALYDLALSGETSQAIATAKSILFIKNEDLFNSPLPLEANIMSSTIRVLPIYPKEEIIQDDETALEYCEVFPNPFSHLVNVRFPLNEGEIWQLRIYDNIGKMVYSKRMDQAGYKGENRETTMKFDLSFLPDGLYQIVIESPYGKECSEKIVKKSID